MSYAVARSEKKYLSAYSDLFLAKGYSKTILSICKLSISASSKTNMDGSDHRTVTSQRFANIANVTTKAAMNW